MLFRSEMPLSSHACSSNEEQIDVKIDADRGFSHDRYKFSFMLAKTHCNMGNSFGFSALRVKP
jgi:hypothetical protein